MRKSERTSAIVPSSRSSRPLSPPPSQVEWSALLADAVNTPGVVHAAYSRFWNYSVGNQLLAWFQCVTRKLDPGPINTFRGWLDCGRHVRKGERAITLCMPVTVQRKRDDRPASVVVDTDVTDPGKLESFTRFVYRARWFVLCQTDGEAFTPPPIPDWDESRALSALDVRRVPFDHPDGNCQGYARDRSVAVSPIAFAPHRTLFHEVAHVLLGHTAEFGLLDDHDRTPRTLREAEAESVALICTESLDLGGAEYSRGYIQHWLKGQPIPEKSAHRIFRVADQILRAGRPAEKGGGS